MTDIRRHGFESDAQWREYLDEIEEAAVDTGSDKTRESLALRDIADLRMEIAGLRHRIKTRIQPEKTGLRWRILGAGAFLLLLALAGR